MLGSMVADVLSREADIKVRATVRSLAALERGQEMGPNIEWHLIDAEDASDEAQSTLEAALDGVACVVNAIGVIKPYIRDDVEVERQRAIAVNALFPYRLAAIAEKADVRVIQIATDCVYSGSRGRYVESDPHDALDVYGKSKSLGEVPSDVHHLRCSILGPERTAHVSLLDWFLQQRAGASVRGFTNHRWNGITTLHFARLCAPVVRGVELPTGIRHVLPSDAVTKADLLKEIALAFGRTDIQVEPVDADVAVDRTLATIDPESNRRLWEAAGYASPPSVSQMVHELAELESRLLTTKT